MKRALAVVLPVLVGLVVLVAACGGDDASTPSTTAPPRTTATGTTEAVTTTTLGPAVDPGDVAPAVDPTGETLEGSIRTADGRTRTYRLYVPSDRPDDAPLLVALHGGLGNGAQFERTSGFDGLAEANGFLVLYAEGTPTAVGPRNLVWNAGGCCAAAAEQDVDDVGFLTELIGTIVDEHEIDPDRVVMTGHSNGGMMSLRVACEATDLVAAVAVQAGTVFVDDCAPSRPISVLDLHGTADENLPVDGGQGSQSVAGVDFPPVRDGLAAIAAGSGCGSAAAGAARATTQPDVTVESWGPCPDGVEVELVLVEGASHAWMGHEAPSAMSSEPYPDLDASLLVWQFLAGHL